MAGGVDILGVCTGTGRLVEGRAPGTTLCNSEPVEDSQVIGVAVTRLALGRPRMTIEGAG